MGAAQAKITDLVQSGEVMMPLPDACSTIIRTTV